MYKLYILHEGRDYFRSKFIVKIKVKSNVIKRPFYGPCSRI